jgi:hypothetical protein
VADEMESNKRLSSASRVLENNNNVFDDTLDLRSFVGEIQKNQKAIDVADNIYKHLFTNLVGNRSGRKKTHVFLFDEAQELLETHCDIKTFLFRCIRTWLRRRGRATVMVVFSGAP